MPKKNKKEKQSPNIVVFLVEGESDQIALETALSELIFIAHPDYEVRFLLQMTPRMKKMICPGTKNTSLVEILQRVHL